MNCDIVNLNICLTDLDPKQFYVSPTTGKKYVNLQVASRREPDKNGNDLVVTYKKKSGDPTIYVKNSNGKTFNFQNTQSQQTQPPSQTENRPIENESDLPF